MRPIKPRKEVIQLPGIEKLYLTCNRCQNTFFLNHNDIRAAYNHQNGRVQIVCPSCQNATLVSSATMENWDNFNSTIQNLEARDAGWTVSFTDPHMKDRSVN